MASMLKYLPRLAAWGSVSHSRCLWVLPLQCTINQYCSLHHNKHLVPKFHGNDVSSVEAVRSEGPGFLKRWKFRARKFFSDTSKITVASCKIYESLADGIDVQEFFRYFQLPDTFHSWFLVIQLHIWMIMVRTVGERNGRIMRTKLTNAMWGDVEARIKTLSGIQSSKRKESLQSMNDQFRAALISYDEGLFTEDTVLAAAVWRTFFCLEYRDPRLLESMVIYIRKQMEHLDLLNTEELMYNGVISWISLKDVVLHLDNHKT